MPAPNPPPELPATFCREIPYRPGEHRFAPIAAEAGAVWLDSGTAGSNHSRFEIIAVDPSRSTCIELATGSSATAPAPPNAFDLLQQWRGNPGMGYLPFQGGSIGFLGYDLNQQLERLQPSPPAANSLPHAWLAYYPWALVQDVIARRAWLVADSEQALTRAEERLKALEQASPPAAEFSLAGPWRASSSEADYLEAIARIQRWILAGDCYQVNLAQHFSAPYRGKPWLAYKMLRQVLPSPFSAYINTGRGCLLSHSPERLLLAEDGMVTTSPIKGTRPRGDNPAQDQALAQELQRSAKDRAENLMIVDLLRNDLGRSCDPGSIEVDALFELETYANVHHLVSTVSGRLKPEVSPCEALRNAFPGGSITGAPKIRAMDIINELEPVARSAYCGSVLYYSNHGRLDSNIAIRTLVADGELMHCWGGGGIVADSIPAEEYAESITKIEVLLRALESGTGP